MTQRKKAPNSLACNGDRIVFSPPSVYHTYAQGEALRVIKGRVSVYLVPITQSEQSNKHALICSLQVPSETIIPALMWMDEEGESWCFCIAAEEAETTLARCQASSEDLDCFLEKAGFASKERISGEALKRFYEMKKSNTENLLPRHEQPCNTIEQGEDQTDEESLKLDPGEVYFSQESDEAWFVSSGSVNVYVVPFSSEETPLRREFLRTASDEDGSLIPGLCYGSGEVTFRIAISPIEQKTILKKTICTQTARIRFLENTPAYSYTQEGFDAAVAQFYRKQNELAQLVKQAESRRAKQEIHRAQRQAIHHGLNKEAHQTVDKNGSVLYHTMAFLCKKGKIKLAPEEELKRLCAKEELTIEDMAQTSHFICRPIVLEDRWWRSDCGLLLCECDQKPVACVPMAGGKYVCYDAMTGRTEKLTEKMAKQLSPQAYSIRRSLPLSSLTRKDILRFVKDSISGRDVLRLSLLGILCLIVSLLLPYLNQRIYDDYIPMGEVDMLAQLCLVIGTFMLGNILFTLVKKLFEFRISTKAGYELQDAIFYRIFQLKESFLRNFESGDLAQRVQEFDTVATDLVKKVVISSLTAVFSLLYVFQMVLYAKALTLVAVLMMAVYGIAVFIIACTAEPHEKVKAESNNRAMAKLHQYLDGVQKIRMAGVESRVVLDYMQTAAVTQRASILSNRISALSNCLSDASSTLFAMVLYFLIVNKRIELTTGNFIAFNTAFGSFCGAMMGLIAECIDIWYLRPKLQMLKPLIQAEPEVNQNNANAIVEELNGEISVEKVSFAYAKDTEMVLHDLNFHIRPGEYVGIVGPSGCGKSTLFKLLLGFETPQAGCIKYGKTDIAAMNKQSLRKQLGVVLQNGSLIAGSIYENISITMNRPSREAAKEAIHKVGLEDDIEQMPMHMETVINESAGTISGGQKQRILIARAIAGKPKILLFDEATSALDNITQAKVCRCLSEMNVTRIAIAHRLSTIENCDRILVLDKGHVVQEGTFKELYAQKGLFREMASRQISTDYEEEEF